MKPLLAFGCIISVSMFISAVHGFESIKQRLEKNSILKQKKTIELEYLQETDADYHPFFADSSIILRSRTYLFDHDRDSDYSTGRINNDRYTFATGGWLTFKSGYYDDWLGVGLTQYGSYKLDGSQDEDGALLLRPGQKSINVLGEAYIEILHDYGNFKAYRQKINTPFMNTNDNRMIPQTFEAVKFSSLKNTSVDYILAYVDKIKARNSQSFEDINNVVNNNEPVWVGGIRHRFSPLFRAGAITYHAKDYVDIHYIELDGMHQFNSENRLKYSLQYIDEDSNGKEQGGEIDTDAWGLRLIYTLSDWQFYFNYTDVDEEQSVISPWSSYAGYNSVQINDFNRAGEEAIGVGIGYDFNTLGFKGLHATVKYIDGNTPDSGFNASSDQTEINYDLRYIIQQGPFEGVSIRLRQAEVNRDSYTNSNAQKLSGLDESQFRFIVNYEIKL
jgi:hypothetical protein